MCIKAWIDQRDFCCQNMLGSTEPNHNSRVTIHLKFSCVFILIATLLIIINSAVSNSPVLLVAIAAFMIIAVLLSFCIPTSSRRQRTSSNHFGETTITQLPQTNLLREPQHYYEDYSIRRFNITYSNINNDLRLHPSPGPADVRSQPPNPTFPSIESRSNHLAPEMTVTELDAPPSYATIPSLNTQFPQIGSSNHASYSGPSDDIRESEAPPPPYSSLFPPQT